MIGISSEKKKKNNNKESGNKSTNKKKTALENEKHNSMGFRNWKGTFIET